MAGFCPVAVATEQLDVGRKPLFDQGPKVGQPSRYHATVVRTVVVDVVKLKKRHVRESTARTPTAVPGDDGCSVLGIAPPVLLPYRVHVRCPIGSNASALCVRTSRSVGEIPCEVSFPVLVVGP
jgi:hypothetical protein